MIDVGDAAIVQVNFYNSNGVPTDPTDVSLVLTSPSGVVTAVPMVGLTHGGPGLFTYVFLASESGAYSYTFTGTGAVTQVETGYVLVGKLSYSGPCQPWTTVENVRACCHSLPASGAIDYVNDVIVEAAINLASDLLYRFTAQQYPGTCLETVRPSSLRSTLGTYAAGWSGLTTYNVPLVDESALEPRDVTYTRIPQVDLVSWFPVVGVTQVLIDGTIVNPSTYRLDEWRYLTRLAGPAPDYRNDGWPRDQQMDRPPTEPLTFQVSFLHGTPPPPGGVRAASVLACQFLKACAGQQCQLPPRSSQVQRQGINITLIDPSMLEKGLTGVWECDLFIRSVNPKGYTGGSAVWSPDITPPPRRTG